MPLVFGAHCGSMLALTGTPVNVLVLEASLDAGRGGFGYFEFALVGVPLMIGGIVIAILLGRAAAAGAREPVAAARPQRSCAHAGRAVPARRADVHQLRVREESPLVGADADRARPGDHPDVTLVTVRGAERRGAARADRGRRRPAGARRCRRRWRRSRPSSTSACATRPTPAPVEDDALQPRLRAGRGGDPAALAADRRAAVPRHGDAERRPRGARGAAAGRRISRAAAPLVAGDTLLLQGTWAALDAAAGAARGAGGELARPGAPPGAADGAGGEADARRARRDGGAARDRHRAGRGRRTAGGRRGGAARDARRSRRSTGRSTGRR